MKFTCILQKEKDSFHFIDEKSEIFMDAEKENLTITITPMEKDITFIIHNCVYNTVMLNGEDIGITEQNKVVVSKNT